MMRRLDPMRSADVEGAISSLDTELRNALLVSTECTCAEAASRLGISEEALLMHLRLAKRRLHGALLGADWRDLDSAFVLDAYIDGAATRMQRRRQGVGYQVWRWVTARVLVFLRVRGQAGSLRDTQPAPSPGSLLLRLRARAGALWATWWESIVLRPPVAVRFAAGVVSVVGVVLYLFIVPPEPDQLERTASVTDENQTADVSGAVLARSFQQWLATVPDEDQTADVSEAVLNLHAHLTSPESRSAGDVPPEISGTSLTPEGFHFMRISRLVRGQALPSGAEIDNLLAQAEAPWPKWLRDKDPAAFARAYIDVTDGRVTFEAPSSTQTVRVRRLRPIGAFFLGFLARDRMIATVVDVAKGLDSEEFVFEETGPPRAMRAFGELANMDNVEEKRLRDTWGASRLSEIYGGQLEEAIQRRVTATCTALVADPARLAQMFADHVPEPEARFYDYQYAAWLFQRALGEVRAADLCAPDEKASALWFSLADEVTGTVIRLRRQGQ